MPPDPTGVHDVNALRVTRDGRSYAYSYLRVLYSDLYLMEGVK